MNNLYCESTVCHLWIWIKCVTYLKPQYELGCHVVEILFDVWNELK